MIAEHVGLRAEQPPAPQSIGAEGPQLEGKGSLWAEVPLPPGIDISRSGPLAKQSRTCGCWASRCVSLQSGQDLDSRALFLCWMLASFAEGIQWPTRSLQFSPASNMNLTELERTIFLSAYTNMICFVITLLLFCFEGDDGSGI